MIRVASCDGKGLTGDDPGIADLGNCAFVGDAHAGGLGGSPAGDRGYLPGIYLDRLSTRR